MIKISAAQVIPCKRQSISRIMDDKKQIGLLIVTRLQTGGYHVSTKVQAYDGRTVTVEQNLPETAKAEDCIQKAISAVKTVLMNF